MSHSARPVAVNVAPRPMPFPDQRFREAIDAARDNGRDEGHRRGYVEGHHVGMWIGIVAGAVLFAVGFVATIRVLAWIS